MKSFSKALMLLTTAAALSGCCGDWFSCGNDYCCPQPCPCPEPCEHLAHEQVPKTCCPEPSCEGYYARPYLWDVES